MLLANYSWADILSWLIGILVLYEVTVYVIFTYGKKLFGSKKNGYELEDTDENSTESRIAKLDEMEDASYESNEYHVVDDEQFKPYSEDDGESNNNPPPQKEGGQTDRDENDDGLGEDGMYHSTLPDVSEEERKDSETDNNPPQESSNNEDTPPEDDSGSDEDEDKLPPNVETESPEDESEIEKNHADSEVYFTKKEFKEQTFGLFNDDNVADYDVLGSDDDADLGNVPNVGDVPVKIAESDNEVDSKNVNFDNCKKFDFPSDLDLEKELKNNQEKSFKYKSNLQNLNNEGEEDETPQQDEPDE